MNIKSDTLKFLKNVRDEKQKWLYSSHFNSIATIGEYRDLECEIIALERTMHIIERM